jgi:uncharacterized phage infection (PIP) family protein YhgE
LSPLLFQVSLSLNFIQKSLIQKFAGPEIANSIITEIIPVVVSEFSSLQPADTFASDDVKIIHESKISASNSYVIEPKLSKFKSNKPKIINSVSERPQTAREKMRKPVEVKPDVKYSHKLGELPKYLQKRKEQSTATSKCSLQIDETRPKTVDLSIIGIQKALSKAQFIVKPQREIQGDVKSEKSQVSLIARPQKITESKSKIPLPSKDNEMLKLECDKLKSNVNEINEQLKSKAARIKSLEMQVARYQKELKQNAEIVDKQLNSEAEIMNLKKSIDNLNGRLKIKDDAINRLKNDTEKLNNELKMLKSSFETLSMEKNELQTLLNNLKKKEIDESKQSLASEIATMALKEQLNEKCDEIAELKKKIASLNDELVSFFYNPILGLNIFFEI